jgi:ATP phosphoribosyltransferase
MLRIAVPNKGSLSQPAADLLAEAGYRRRRDTRQLVLTDEDNGVELFFLRPRDVAVYVGAGTVDCGITGRDLLLDSGADAVEHRALGFARSRFRFAAPVDGPSSVEELAGTRIATSYDTVVRSFLAERGIEAGTVHLDGAVESAVRLGIADVVADVVETGSTLAAAGLEVFGEPVLESEAVLIRNATADVPAGLDILDRRVEGVLVARQYVLIDYDVRREDLERTVAVAPGRESPTISPLRDDEWAAVRVMVERAQMNKIMDELYAAGPRDVRADLHRPFRSLLVRVVARALQVAVLLGALAIMFLTGRIPGVDHWNWPDQLGTAIVGLLIIAALERWSRLAALPSEDGLAVRNFVGTRRLQWAEILGVEFGEHRPWAVLDLSDGSTVSVMAIQRSDGDRAARDAARLSTLVELHAREAGADDAAS